jgi:hypothetical protein
MKKIINGKRYNTKTAKELAHIGNRNDYNDFNFWRETLYVKKTGEYFLLKEGGANSKYGVWNGNSGGYGEFIEPILFDNAKKWAEQLDGDEYETIFGDVIQEDVEMNQLISLLLPKNIHSALKDKSNKTGQNINVLIKQALIAQGYGE